jgi:hypothetical protein
MALPARMLQPALPGSGAGPSPSSHDRRRGLAFLGAMILLAGAFVPTDFPRHWGDSPIYIAMVQGLPVLMPWAGRILLPDLVRMITHLSGIGMDTCFEAITCLSFICWLSLTSLRWQASRWLAPFLIVPLVLKSLQSVYIVDMFHMALTAIFFALLAWNAIAASVLMVVMTTARESSMMFAFVACGVLLFNRRWVAASVMLAGWAAGAMIVHHATAGAQNVHRMPELLYLIGKIPLNFVRNWFGVPPWTNGYAWCDAPLATMTLPAHLHLGVITRIGFCAPLPGVPLTTASSYVTVFGVLPAILAATIRSHGIPRRLWRQVWWATAFISGGVLMVLGPLVGSPVDRTIGFGWPLLFIALPALWRDAPDWRLAALQIGAAWSPLLLSQILAASPAEHSFIGVSPTPAVAAWALAIGTAANIAAYRMIRSRAAVYDARAAQMAALPS